MPHHEESPEKLQYNMATPPFLDKPPHFAYPPPFLAKIFRPPPFPSIFKKSNYGLNYVFPGVGHFCRNFLSFIFRNISCNNNLAGCGKLIFTCPLAQV